MLHVLFLCHALATIGYGRFSQARVVTWVALILSFSVIPALAAFTSFAVPWGQLSYLLASVVTGVIGVAPGNGGVADWLYRGLASWPGETAGGDAAALAIFGIDVAVMYGGLWRSRSTSWVIGRVLLVVVASLVLSMLADALVNHYAPPPPPPDPAGSQGPFTPMLIVPETWLLPVYSILRSAPQKLLGAALAFAALLIPAFAPLMRAWRFNADRRRWLWWPACAGLAACWLALGWLGGQAPYGATILWSQVAAAGYFGFFLVPVLLR